MKNNIAFTCDIRAFEQGYQAVKAAAMIARGEKVEPNIVVEMKILDKSNIEESAR